MAQGRDYYFRDRKEIEDSSSSPTLVKEEFDLKICYGCLSTDRNLSVLGEDSALFLNILGQDHEISATSIFVCWECAGILRKLRIFQRKVQFAQGIMRQGLYEKFENCCLSTLAKVILHPDETKLHPETYSESHHTSRTNSATLNINHVSSEPDINVTNNQPVLSTDIKIEFSDEGNTDIKYESDEDYKPEFDDENINETNIDNDDLKKIRKRGGSIPYAKIGRFVENTEIDIKNVNECFTDVCFTEAEMASKSLGRKIRNQKFWRGKPMCRKCKWRFGSPLHLNMHLTFYHLLNEQSTRPYTCLVCKKVCSDASSLRLHWKRHNQGSKCNICNGLLDRCKRSKYNHLATHKRFMYCNYCEGKFWASQDLRNHYRSIHRYSVCDYCKKRYRSKIILEDHIRKYHMPLECKKCEKSFAKIEYLERHNQRVHPTRTNPELSFCVECNKQFSTISRYKSHLKSTKTHNSHKKPDTKIIPCPDCGQEFRRLSYMKNHYNLIHKGKTKHYCSLCDKYFVTGWALKVHNENVHLKIKAPKDKICDFCGRGFSTNAGLQKHCRTHTGERPYKCTHCPSAFSQKHPLVSHMKTQHKIPDPYSVLPTRLKDIIGLSIAS